jgi:hypothetical protein
MALAPVGLALQCEGPVRGAAPQLMLLDKINTQNERFIQIGYDIKFVLDELFVYAQAEFISASDGKQLVSWRFKLRCRVTVSFLGL